MTIIRAFFAGLVRRWHTHAHMADVTDTLDAHQGRVARIILACHPSPSVDLLAYALTHDDGETVGDIPSHVKDRLPREAREHFDRLEAAARHDLWPHLPGMLSGQDALWLRFSDLLDRYQMVAHHRPGILWSFEADRKELMAIATQLRGPAFARHIENEMRHMAGLTAPRPQIAGDAWDRQGMAEDLA